MKIDRLGIAGSLVPLLIATATAAQVTTGFETTRLAADMGTLLASEQTCGLTFDQAAIRAFIDEKVDPGDLHFPGTLLMMTDGAALNQEGLSASQKTAHCHATERLARHYKFID